VKSLAVTFGLKWHKPTLTFHRWPLKYRTNSIPNNISDMSVKLHFPSYLPSSNQAKSLKP